MISIHKTMKKIAVLILGWLVPGLGHIVQKKYARGFTFLACILGMTAMGLWMSGRIYPFQTENPLTILAFFRYRQWPALSSIPFRNYRRR